MLFEFMGKQFELSKSDADIWQQYWNVERMEHRGHRQFLMGACPFCEVFKIRRNNYESNCTECPLAIYEENKTSAKYGSNNMHILKERIEGCTVLLEHVLGPKAESSLVNWSLIFHETYVVVWGGRGIESCNKIRRSIIESVIDKNDREGINEYLTKDTKESEKDGTGETEKK